jgi:hypothetical protein
VWRKVTILVGPTSCSGLSMPLRSASGDADRYKGRWLLLVLTLMAVLFGIAFARYAFHHQPIRHSIANSNR